MLLASCSIAPLSMPPITVVTEGDNNQVTPVQEDGDTIHQAKIVMGVDEDTLASIQTQRRVCFSLPYIAISIFASLSEQRVFIGHLPDTAYCTD